MKKYLYTIDFPIKTLGTLFVERDNPNLTLEELERTITDEELTECHEYFENEITSEDIEEGLRERRDWFMEDKPTEIFDIGGMAVFQSNERLEKTEYKKIMKIGLKRYEEEEVADGS